MRIFSGAIIGGLLGALLTGVPMLGAGGTPKIDWPKAVLMAGGPGSIGAAAGLVIGAIFGWFASLPRQKNRAESIEER
jgi:hypothetical protein